jgi:ribosome-binding protein aMBF1 (putative translation factor)
MKTTTKQLKAVDFNEVLVKKLKNPEFKKLFDEYGRQLEVAYQILQLRQKKKMSQSELARRVGTTQSNVARIESGQQNFTVSLLQKVATALDSDLKISFVG